jgi:ABC-type branched-subunit amino acid transport system substrate-binding protein
VARDLIADAGGQVLGERYLPIGETDIGRLIDEIRSTRPDFVLNNLIGTSSYAFIDAYAALGRNDPHFRPDRCPVLSCNLTECELEAIGAAGNGHLSAGPYFRRPAIAGTSGRPESSFEAAAYASVRVLAEVLAMRQSASFADLPAIFAERRFDTPFGRTAIDPRTQHASLPVEIGRIADGAFEVVGRTEAVEPDPYLSRYDRVETFGRPRLKVVS